MKRKIGFLATLMLMLALVVGFTAPVSKSQAQNCLSVAVTATPVSVALGDQVIITGTVTNSCNGPKRLDFEIGTVAPCSHDGLYQLQLFQPDISVRGHGTYSQSVSYTPDCADSWQGVSAFLFQGQAVEAAAPYVVQ